MMNALKTRPDEGFPKESLAGILLKKDPFKYSPGIACEVCIYSTVNELWSQKLDILYILRQGEELRQ